MRTTAASVADRAARAYPIPWARAVEPTGPEVLLSARRVWSIVALTGVAAVVACCARDAPHPANATLPARRPVRIVVGYPAGGGYDLGARLVARHLGRHLPGTPAVFVENMPGAGGLAAAKYLSTVAERDGLTLGLLSSNSFVALGAAVADVPPPTFGLLGSPAPVVPVCAFTRRSGITTWDDWTRTTTPPRLGSAGPGSISHVIARILQRAAGVPIRLVAGYAGSAEARMALTSGELDGFCATWETLEGLVAEGDDLRPVLRLSERRLAGVDRLPDALALMPNERARRLLAVGVYATNALGRVYVVPPGTPAAVRDVLRTALARTFADAAFAREAAAAAVSLLPLSAADVESALQRITDDPATVDELRALVAAP